MTARTTALLLFGLLATTTPAPVFADGPLDVLDFGAKGDGQANDAAAFQAALDAAGAAGGGVVRVPRGVYSIAGSLKVPAGVTLKGVWESVPAHNGIRDEGLPKPTDDGSTLLITEGQGSEEGPPFLTLNTNSTLKGMVLYYPNQRVDQTPKPYPWAIALRGKNPAVLDVELLNPYNGIDATNNERHLIRNVHGQPLRRGILVDSIYDIGRIENVHFNPWWSVKPEVLQWQMQHGEAFVFGRTDWHYVLNTFCFGYRVGYRFLRSETGVCNGNFLGIGADACETCVLVEDSAPYGLLITNGEFVAFKGPEPTMVRVEQTNAGAVRFVNCAYWGRCNQIAQIAGRGTVGFSDCTFCRWDAKQRGLSAIEASGGALLVRGCEFQQDKPQVSLRSGAQGAVVTGNVVRGAVRVENQSEADLQLSANVVLLEPQAGEQ